MTHIRSAVLAVLVVGVAVHGVALAAELHVPGEYDTLADALSAAQSGDEVVVAEGVYTSPNVEINGKQLTVRGAGAALSSVDCRTDIGGNARVVYSDLRMTWSPGSAVYIGDANVTFRSCDIDHGVFGVGISAIPDAPHRVHIIDSTINGGLRLNNNAICVAEGSTIFGRGPFHSTGSDYWPAMPAVVTETTSAFFAVDCAITGGNAVIQEVAKGGSALELYDASSAYLSGCALASGQGFNTPPAVVAGLNTRFEQIAPLAMNLVGAGLESPAARNDLNQDGVLDCADVLTLGK